MPVAPTCHTVTLMGLVLPLDSVLFLLAYMLSKLSFASFLFFNAYDESVPPAGTSYGHSTAVHSSFPSWSLSAHPSQQRSVQLEHRDLSNKDDSKTQKGCVQSWRCKKRSAVVLYILQFLPISARSWLY